MYTCIYTCILTYTDITDGKEPQNSGFVFSSGSSSVEFVINCVNYDYDYLNFVSLSEVKCLVYYEMCECTDNSFSERTE